MTADSRDWVRDALRQFSDEVRLFSKTAIEVTLHPFRFGEEWVSGSRRALNPLGFLATASAIVGPALAVVAQLLHRDEAPLAVWMDALGALLPFGYYLVLGGLQHAALRLLGSKRRLRDSCAMALYAPGGPGLVAQLAVMAVVLTVHYRYGVGDMVAIPTRAKWPAVIVTLALFLVPYATLALSMAGLHRSCGIRGWHIVVANVVALLITAFLFAILNPPGNYGLHFVLGPRLQDATWKMIFSATF